MFINEEKKKKTVKIRKVKKRGRGIPNLYKNRVYFGKKYKKGVVQFQKLSHVF